MTENHKNGVIYLSFEKLDALGVRHCFTTRAGGVSEGIFESLNFSVSLGDSRENVMENHRRIAGAVGFSPEDTVFTQQTHSANLLRVFKSDRGKGLFAKRDYSEIDGIATDCRGLVLTAFASDCAVIFFYDASKHAAAICHAGWKGTAGNIAGKTLDFMEREFDSDAKDIFCGISPCIGQCCFETDSDVYSELAGYPEFIINGGRKYNIDLAGINGRQLETRGVPPENIEIAEICTKCREDSFFSHRRNGRQRGSMAAFITLREKL